MHNQREKSRQMKCQLVGISYPIAQEENLSLSRDSSVFSSQERIYTGLLEYTTMPSVVITQPTVMSAPVMVTSTNQSHSNVKSRVTQPHSGSKLTTLFITAPGDAYQQNREALWSYHVKHRGLTAVPNPSSQPDSKPYTPPVSSSNPSLTTVGAAIAQATSLNTDTTSSATPYRHKSHSQSLENIAKYQASTDPTTQNLSAFKSELPRIFPKLYPRNTGLRKKPSTPHGPCVLGKGLGPRNQDSEDQDSSEETDENLDTSRPQPDLSLSLPAIAMENYRNSPMMIRAMSTGQFNEILEDEDNVNQCDSVRVPRIDVNIEGGYENDDFNGQHTKIPTMEEDVDGNRFDSVRIPTIHVSDVHSQNTGRKQGKCIRIPTARDQFREVLELASTRLSEYESARNFSENEVHINTYPSRKVYPDEETHLRTIKSRYIKDNRNTGRKVKESSYKREDPRPQPILFRFLRAGTSSSELDHDQYLDLALTGAVVSKYSLRILTSPFRSYMIKCSTDNADLRQGQEEFEDIVASQDVMDDTCYESFVRRPLSGHGQERTVADLIAALRSKPSNSDGNKVEGNKPPEEQSKPVEEVKLNKVSAEIFGPKNYKELNGFLQKEGKKRTRSKNKIK